MNFNFPLILLLATSFTAVVVLLDKFWLSKKRADGEAPSSLVEQSKSFFPVLLVVFVLRSFVAEPFQIPSGSMEPGLVQGDFIVVSKFSYGLRMPVFDFTLIPTGQPERGDVMVFFPPNDPRYFIKRVIGLPGDHIVFRDKRLTINGDAVPLIEHPEQLDPKNTQRFTEHLGKAEAEVQWIRRYFLTPQGSASVIWAGPEGEWTVPEGHYFMMGDNRGNSGDSREWGFVPERNIVGKAVAIWTHWESWGSLPSFSRNTWIQ